MLSACCAAPCHNTCQDQCPVFAPPGTRPDPPFSPPSGGPALRGANGGNVVVGVAFQNLPSADSIGYIIPIVSGAGPVVLVGVVVARPPCCGLDSVGAAH